MGEVSASKAPMPLGESVEPHRMDTLPQDKLGEDRLSRLSCDCRSRVESSDTGDVARSSNGINDGVASKHQDLDRFRVKSNGKNLTTNFGTKVSNNQNTLRIGERGPSLLEDFIFREKVMSFDHERIPERVVHARGAGAHGYFQLYKSMSRYTKARFLNDTGVRTPVYVRFSTVQGSRGSGDTVRDVRGFATKFYTSEGNFDIVGNNMGVFFIQDAIKFPDFVHALKPEPDNEIPQGQTAHNSFWDYVSLQPETLNNVIWAMSDRAIPRSYATMEGFGINTYLLVNDDGEGCFVRFHWKPMAGTVSLIWDEALLLNGVNPDFHRCDLWERIEAGKYPEFELGFQIISEKDQSKFDFDILDATKIIPESLVPVEIVGKMVLDRNPDNYFAETEQVAFCPGNIVPGIDFSNDPLLQGRLFSYKDTQLTRLGGPNFNEIPINRPICPFQNNQRDGYHRMAIYANKSNYEPNSTNNNWPREATKDGFETYSRNSNCDYRCDRSENGGGCSECTCSCDECHCESVNKIRRRPMAYREFYSHCRLFWLSQTEMEQNHIVSAFTFELSKVGKSYIRERVVDLLCRIDHDLARRVAKNISVELSQEQLSRPHPKPINGVVSRDSTLSLYNGKERPLIGCKIAVLVSDGYCSKSLDEVLELLNGYGVFAMIVGPHVGAIRSMDGSKLVEAGNMFKSSPSLLFDAIIFVAQGEEALTALKSNDDVSFYLLQTFRHLKPMAFQGNTRVLYENAVGRNYSMEYRDEGILMGDDSSSLVNSLMGAMKKHRIWARETIFG